VVNGREQVWHGPLTVRPIVVMQTFCFGIVLCLIGIFLHSLIGIFPSLCIKVYVSRVSRVWVPGALPLAPMCELKTCCGWMQRCVALFLTLWTSLALTGCGSAPVDDLLREQAVLEDATGALSFDEAREATFKPFSGVLTRGYTPSSFWFKLVVSEAPDGGEVQLRVRPTFLDDVRLYEPDPVHTQQWRERVGGDRFTAAAQGRVTTPLGFTLARSSQPQTTYYLRVQTQSSSMVYLQALPKNQALTLDGQLMAWQMVYTAILLWMALWALQDYWLHRSVSSLSFFAYQLCNVVYGTYILGFAIFWPSLEGAHGLDRMTSWSVIAVSVFGLVFHSTLLRSLGLPRRWGMLTNGLVAAALLLAMALGLGWVREAMWGNSLLVTVAGPVLFALTWGLRGQLNPTKRLVIWLYGLQLSSLAVSMAPLLGWVHVSEVALYAYLSHGLTSSLVMFYLLIKRSLAVVAQREAAERARGLAQQQLEMQREYSAEQGRFIDMLTHELKTPVAVALMSLDRIKAGPQPTIDRIRRALGNINGIVERARWSDMLAHHQVQAVLREVSLSEQVFEAVESTLKPDRIGVKIIASSEVTVDPQLLGIVLSNLLDNALKYAPANSAVAVRIDRAVMDGRWGAQVEVINRVGNAGMPDPTRLFTKYYRSAGAGSISGSGLGLYLVQQLAGLLRGQVLWRGQGDQAVLVLWLPL
jgi:two-component system, sensor histidine kinase LadS